VEAVHDAIRQKLEEFGQEHVLRFWDELDAGGRASLTAQLEGIDFPLVQRLVDTWGADSPPPEPFETIEPVEVIPLPSTDDPAALEALDAGETALRAGRVGLVLVAGGQGTRLGFAGPKGSFPISGVTGRTLFEFHADKIHNLQNRYGQTLPWYIMVGESNEAATKEFFREKAYFGLNEADVIFFKQAMMPCVSGDGKFVLEAPDRLAMNPNGHGGCIPGLVESGIAADARGRRIDTLSYFQVDNWAANIADPYFIGYHLLRGGDMSSKIAAKTGPREAVGVHCVCDGVSQVVEYTELDIYPTLLDTGAQGELIYPAGNTAIHVISVDFVESVYDAFEDFPWHCSHKKIPCIDDAGARIDPAEPNGYKFETFVFDSLRYITHPPVALEIDRTTEYTPTKSMTGVDSVEQAQNLMTAMWSGWLEAAGCAVPRANDGAAVIDIEINPRFALDRTEFLEKTQGWDWPNKGRILIGPDGALD
jgi:UDP-N-acetylglucosamine/UDP-N-acetylgalactosamine diphosphorylase